MLPGSSSKSSSCITGILEIFSWLKLGIYLLDILPPAPLSVFALSKSSLSNASPQLLRGGDYTF